MQSLRVDRQGMQNVSSYLEQLTIRNNDFIIINEIGKLGLQDQGFEPDLGKLIASFKESKVGATLIMVVRCYLIPQVTDKYALSHAKIMDKDQLNF